MKVHIVGAGPTGLSLAWEIKKFTDNEVHVYDRKTSAGGSWWEPDVDYRDVHAHRIVFDNAFVNTQNLFKEMGIEWNDIFEKTKKDPYDDFFKNLKIPDYWELSKLFVRVLNDQEKYKKIPLIDEVQNVSDSCAQFLETITFVMDGVSWETMSAYEFIMNFNHVALSNQYTQKVSGKVMNDAMQNALVDIGVIFHFEMDLIDVDYRAGDYMAYFKDGTNINDGLLVLCVDNSKALKLIKDNWGPDGVGKIRSSTYGALSVMMDYATPIDIPSDVFIAMNTEWRLQPVVLSDGKTISCVICDLTREIVHSDPETILFGIMEQFDKLGIQKPINMRFGWGCRWNGTKWEFEQSSGVLNLNGHLPYFGKSSAVAMCGMMSERRTPYSSIESSVEVSRSFSAKYFKTRKPKRPVLFTDLFYAFIIFTMVIIFKNFIL